MIYGIPITGLTAPALLGFTILLFITGRIWTDRAYQEKAKESERWRLAYEKERDARITSEDQTEELLELAKTNHAIVYALFQNSERSVRQTGGSDVAKKT